jgi:hypothetical protein
MASQTPALKVVDSPAVLRSVLTSSTFACQKVVICEGVRATEDARAESA